MKNRRRMVESFVWSQQSMRSWTRGLRASSMLQGKRRRLDGGGSMGIIGPSSNSWSWYRAEHHSCSWMKRK